MSDFADHLLGHVRILLKQHPSFAHMTRDDLDNVVLADLERDLRRDLEDWIAETAVEIRSEVEMDLEFKAEMEAAAAKKAKRTKPRAHAKTGEAA
jgi:hypothetical protein